MKIGWSLLTGQSYQKNITNFDKAQARCENLTYMKETIQKIITWIKTHKLVSVLIIIILILGSSSPNTVRPYGRGAGFVGNQSEIMMGSAPYAEDMAVSTKSMPVPMDNIAPRPDITDRRVITNASMSLQVKNVRDTLEIIKSSVKELGGYVVDSNINTPELGESGYITVRVPTNQLDEAMKRFRTISIKVVSENTSGSDITDQYTDIQERLTKLEATKTRFEEIYNRAVSIEDILNVQMQIFAVQDQIDYYKGQIEYLKNSSDTSLISINLATDELGLPYTPAQAWRPEAIFKEASRAMLMDLIKIGNGAIWIVVYVPFILVAWLIFVLIKRRIKK